jgi:CRISPR-associated protein Cmr4
MPTSSHRIAPFSPSTTCLLLNPSVAVMTAYLLSFPVRSLKGIYTSVTSPFLLKRFANYLDAASVLNEEYSKMAEIIKRIADTPGIFPATEGFNNRHVVEGLNGAILCEEVGISKDSISEKDEMDELRGSIGLEGSESLISLDDNMAKDLIEKSLVRVTRIRIDRDRKTVTGGGLWTEEAVPAGTVFATVFLAYSKEYLSNIMESIKQKEGPSESKWKEVKEKYLGNKRTPMDVILDEVKYLIIGGDESIGRGVVELREMQPWKKEGR